MQCPCLFNGWTAQFAKFIDPNAPAPLQLVDLRSSPIREKVELMATCEFVNPKKLRAAAGPDDDPYVGRARLSPKPGQSRFLALMPSTTARKAIGQSLS